MFWYDDRMKNDNTTRTCKKCGEAKSIGEFPSYGAGKRHECIACNRLRLRSWYSDNSKRLLEKAREKYAKDPSAFWTQKRRSRANEMARKRNAELRHIVFSAYGNKCECCGETNEMFLTIDHINNDGHKMRKTVHGSASSSLYRWVIKNKFPKDIFQILCMNCNWGKARNGGICPHQEGSTTSRKA